MKKVLVLYYSMYGHIEKLADAVAEGARGVADTEVVIKRVPELVPAEVLAKSGAKVDQAAAIATVEELADYDAIIFGSPTRFGNVASQLRNFMDQTGGLWARGALSGKLASVFTSSATGAGNETTILSFWPTLAHHGMTILPLPYSKAPQLFDVSQVRGGSPYGASTMAGGDGSRQPTDTELEIARSQGRYVAEYAQRLK